MPCSTASSAPLAPPAHAGTCAYPFPCSIADRGSCRDRRAEEERRSRLPASADKIEHDRWLSVEVRHLTALRTVAEEGTFGAAALKLGYAQSAISAQIAALERFVGKR